MEARKVERFLENLKEPALKQVIRVLLVGDIEVIEKQIEEFWKMYPESEVE